MYTIGYIEEDYTEEVGVTQEGVYNPEENSIDMVFKIKDKEDELKIYYPIRFVIEVGDTGVKIDGTGVEDVGGGRYQVKIRGKGRFEKEEIEIKFTLPSYQCYELEYFMYGY